jgi:hypothetical protein
MIKMGVLLVLLVSLCLGKLPTPISKGACDYAKWAICTMTSDYSEGLPGVSLIPGEPSMCFPVKRTGHDLDVYRAFSYFGRLIPSAIYQSPREYEQYLIDNDIYDTRKGYDNRFCMDPTRSHDIYEKLKCKGFFRDRVGKITPGLRV